MATSIQARPSGSYQLRVTHKLLPRPFIHSFDSAPEAQAYGESLVKLLRDGIVPAEMLKGVPKGALADPLILEVVRSYTRLGAITDSDDELLSLVIADAPVIGLRASGVTWAWAEGYVQWLKSPAKNITPGSIRKRVGALARVIDWHLGRTTARDAQRLANPLRLLPKGYSVYSRADARLAPVRRDTERNRRLSPQEDAQIRAALAGVQREDRQRPFTTDAAFCLLYALIVDTGMRLFEAYRLRVDSIDHRRRVINVEGSKGHRGHIKPRVVPIKEGLRAPLLAWCEGRVGLLFPYWDGDDAGKKKTTAKLSARFAGLFDYAGVPACSEHDLRHEAACRWFELRNERGWVFSETEICRIMGWADSKLALRYASLRGEDLSARLG